MYTLLPDASFTVVALRYTDLIYFCVLPRVRPAAGHCGVRRAALRSLFEDA